MRVVARPEEVVGTGEAEVVQADGVVDVRAPDVVAEVVRRLLGERVVHQREEPAEGGVDATFEACGVVDARLGRDDVQRRVALEHAGGDELDDAALHFVARLETEVEGVLDGRTELGHAVLGAVAGEDVDRQRHVERGRRRPQRLVVVTEERVRAISGWRSPKETATKPERLGALELAHRLADVPQRQQRDAEQASGVGRTKRREPVVVDAQARRLKSGVVEL